MDRQTDLATPAPRSGDDDPVSTVGDGAPLHDLGGELLASTDLDAMFAVVSRRAVADVPGAEQAGVTVQRGHRYVSLALRGQDVPVLDRLQYELRSGPALDALTADDVVRVDDLAADVRWPDFGPQAVERTGVRSLMSYRLGVGPAPTVTASLTLYATRPHAFHDDSRRAALLLATFAAHAVGAVAAAQKATNLRVALANSQLIGAAIGVVMALHAVDRENAFDLLRLASQRQHRKLADIAGEVVETGALP